jgi:hypothetical protein
MESPVRHNFLPINLAKSVVGRKKKLLHIVTNKDIHFSQVLVAHACNPSYSGGRDQEDCGSNRLQDPVSKEHITKKGWWSGSRCRP